MLWFVVAVLLAIWVVGLVLEVTMAAIHLLVVAAVALAVWNFLRGRAARTHA